MLNVDDTQTLLSLPIGAVIRTPNGQVFVRVHPSGWTHASMNPEIMSNKAVAQQLPATLLHPAIYDHPQLEQLGEKVAEMFGVTIEKPDELGAAILAVNHGIAATIDRETPPTLAQKLTMWWDNLWGQANPDEQWETFTEAGDKTEQMRAANKVGDVAEADQLQAELRDLKRSQEDG